MQFAKYIRSNSQNDNGRVQKLSFKSQSEIPNPKSRKAAEKPPFELICPRKAFHGLLYNPVFIAICRCLQGFAPFLLSLKLPQLPQLPHISATKSPRLYLKLLVLFLVIQASAAGPIPPVAIARLCGNRVVHRSETRAMAADIRREGCEEVRTVILDPEYRLMYGIRVLIGEANAARRPD